MPIHRPALRVRSEKIQVVLFYDESIKFNAPILSMKIKTDVLVFLLEWVLCNIVAIKLALSLLN